MKIKIDKQQVGFRIKEIRISKGYTLESFGKIFSATKSNAQKWETGFTLPNKERLANISEMAGITVNELLYGSIDEFLENNFSNLILDYKYPYPLSFDFNIYLKKYKLEVSETIDINSIDEVIRVFYKILDDYIKHVICLDYLSLQVLLNDDTEEIKDNLNIIIKETKNILNSVVSKNENTKEIIDEFELKLKNSNIIDYFSKLQIDENNMSQESIKYFPIVKELLLYFKNSNNIMIKNTIELYTATSQFVNEHKKLELIEDELIRDTLSKIIIDALENNRNK